MMASRRLRILGFQLAPPSSAQNDGDNSKTRQLAPSPSAEAAGDNCTSEQPTRVPIFICNVVAPTQTYEYQIFEPRYVRLIEDLLAAGRTEFGVCLDARALQDSRTDEQSILSDVPPSLSPASTFARVGTLVRVQDYTQLPNGRYAIRVEGRCRFRIVDEQDADSEGGVTEQGEQSQYHVADIVPLHDSASAAPRERYNSLRLKFDAIRRSCLQALCRPPAPPEVVYFVSKAYPTWETMKAAIEGAEKGEDVECELPWSGEEFVWNCLTCMPIPEAAKYEVLQNESPESRCHVLEKWLQGWSNVLAKKKVP